MQPNTTKERCCTLCDCSKTLLEGGITTTVRCCCLNTSPRAAAASCSSDLWLLPALPASPRLPYAYCTPALPFQL